MGGCRLDAGPVGRLASFVGSWNLDWNSADRNHEAGIICLDRSLNRQMEEELARDLANSIPVVSSNEGL